VSYRKREEGQNGYKHTHIAKRLRVDNQKYARNRKEWKKAELLSVEKKQNEVRGHSQARI
jgi:DNA-directed RNA polymerase specialized sigma subunit